MALRHWMILGVTVVGLLLVGGSVAYHNALPPRLAIPNPILPGSELSRLMHDAQAASRAGDHKRAAELYTQALAVEPGPNIISRDLHAWRGSEYNYVDMSKEAAADYDTALRVGYFGEMSEEAIRAHMGRGYALMGLDQYRRAKNDFDIVLKHVPNDGKRASSTLAWRGGAWQGLGDRARAIADYQAALALDPNNGYARDGLKDLQDP